MHVVLICAYFDELYLIPFLYLQTYFSQYFFDFRVEHYSSVLCRTHVVID